MSGFWNSELGEVTGASEDAFAKQFRIIPDNTTALAKIINFKNDKDLIQNEFINIEWELIGNHYDSCDNIKIVLKKK